MDRFVRLWAALCYLPFACITTSLVCLLWYPHNSYAVYHARQGFALFVLWFLSLFLVSLFFYVGVALWIALLFLSIRAGYFAFKGRNIHLPLVGSISSLMPVGQIYSILTGRSL